MSKRDYRVGAISFAFIALPRAIVLSEEWQALPASAKALAIDLTAQYTGKNNGRLCPGMEPMRRCGWNSANKLIRAKRALLNCSFVVLTRKGHPPRTTEWIAFTWWKLDFEKSMEVDPRRFPYLNFEPLSALSVIPKRHDKAKKTAPGHPVSALPTAVRPLQ